MNNKRYVARSTAIAARVLGDETMVMSATNSTLFTLDEIAKGTCFIGTYRQPRPATLRALAPVAPKLRHETLEMAGS